MKKFCLPVLMVVLLIFSGCYSERYITNLSIYVERQQKQIEELKTQLVASKKLSECNIITLEKQEEISKLKQEISSLELDLDMAYEANHILCDLYDCSVLEGRYDD